MSNPNMPDMRRGQMNEMLQQALQALRTSGAGNSAMTPDALVELARRAGIPNPEQLNDLTRMIGGSPTAERVPQLIIFQLNNVECALPADAVQAVERISEVTFVPNTAPWVLGVVQVWGAIVSVVDMRTFFGQPPQPLSARNRLLIVTLKDMTIGFVVDVVTEMRPIGNETATADPRIPPWIQPYAEGAFHLEDRAIVLLDPERLLFSEAIHHYRYEV
ncbi:MAG TPA: chemotaxis protein CheW [Ktedonobacterales bacterium]|nr:chemotaxis protein CheW [Ktedonobacterales bacterium]